MSEARIASDEDIALNRTRFQFTKGNQDYHDALLARIESEHAKVMDLLGALNSLLDNTDEPDPAGRREDETDMARAVRAAWELRQRIQPCAPDCRKWEYNHRPGCPNDGQRVSA